MAEPDGTSGVRPGGDATPPVPLTELCVGTVLGPWDVPVRTSTIARLWDGLGQHGPEGPPATAPWVLAANLGLGLAFRVVARNVAHTGGTFRPGTAAGPVVAGDVLRVTGTLTAIGARHGRVFTTVTTQVTRAETIVAEVRTDVVVPGADPAGRGEFVPVEVAGPNLDSAPDASGRHLLTLEQMTAFSGAGNFHSDPSIARRFGYDRPVAQGLHVLALAHADRVPAESPGAAIAYRFPASAFAGDSLVWHSAADGIQTVHVASGAPGARPVCVVRHLDD